MTYFSCGRASIRVAPHNDCSFLLVVLKQKGGKISRSATLIREIPGINLHFAPAKRAGNGLASKGRTPLGKNPEIFCILRRFCEWAQLFRKTVSIIINRTRILPRYAEYMGYGWARLIFRLSERVHFMDSSEILARSTGYITVDLSTDHLFYCPRWKNFHQLSIKPRRSDNKANLNRFLFWPTLSTLLCAECHHFTR